MDKHELFISSFAHWAKQKSTILGAALVGSYANGTATEDSDVDLVIITDLPRNLLHRNEWIHAFGEVLHIQEEDYRLVQSRRVFYSQGLEVEFGITTPAWSNVSPIAPGTVNVLSNGYVILDDKGAVFAGLIAAMKSESI